MNRLTPFSVVAFLVASCSAFGGVAGSSYVAVTTELAIDGVACGRVYSVEGGDPRATTVFVSNPGGLALPKKQIVGVSYAPITVEVALPPAQPILDWIGDLCANRQKPKTLLLTTYKASGQVAGNALQANNVLLTEVRFPAFDTGTKDAVRLTLVFIPGSTQASTTSGATSAGASTKAVSAADFRIKIGTLPTTHVLRVEPFTIKQPVVANTVGELRDYTKEPAAPEFSNLILTLSSLDIADWNKWRDSFVVNGNSQDADETSGSLELLSANVTTPVLTLQFAHVGILRASPEKEQAGSDYAQKFQAELYCESMAIGTAPAKPSTPSAAGPAATLAPITTMAPVTAKAATLMPAAATTPAGSSPGGAAEKAGDTAPAGGAAAPQAESSTTAPSSGGAAKGGEAVPSGGADPRAETPAAGTAAASSGKSTAAGDGAAAQARASSGESSAPSAASGSSAGSAASGGGGAAKDSIPPTTTTPAVMLPTSRATGLTPVAAGAPPLTAATTAPTAAAASSVDQGARDPKDIPRPEGAVRKSFSSVRQKTYSQEIAVYSSKSMPDALEEFYTKSLTASGWELSTRVENNGSIANTHQIVVTWKNGLRSVMITLAEVKAGGAEIGVNLTTKFTP